MKKNISGFSIVIALGLVVLISLLAVGILEFIIPFSRNNKGIENSSASYYQANSGIENALYDKGDVVGYETGKTLNGATPVDYSFDVIAMGDTLPPDGQGNSEFDQNWDIISAGNPIQMEVGNYSLGANNFDDLNIAFRVPNFAGGVSKTLSGGTLPIINWQLSAKNNTLNASGSYISENNNICNSSQNFTNCDFKLSDPAFRSGIDLNDSSISISNFYITNCEGTGSGCILKLSIINDLQTLDGEYIPYLEWRMVNSSDIPLRYTIINSEGKSYGFKKSLQIKVPQKTVSEAFDFTVFQ